MSRKYLKIDTLWKRREGKKGAVIPNDYSNPVFPNIKMWIATEKINGENIRIMYDGSTKTVSYAGKTDDAEIFPEIMDYLQEKFSIEKFRALDNFDEDTDITIFAEACHKRILDSYVYLKSDEVAKVIIFDVKIGKWWLEHNNVISIATHFVVDNAPVRYIGTIEELIKFVVKEQQSVLTYPKEVTFEGIVCTPHPMVLNRDGTPVKFKLKVEDFRKLKAIGEEYKV
jgi:hypothetical protein